MNYEMEKTVSQFAESDDRLLAIYIHFIVFNYYTILWNLQFLCSLFTFQCLC